MILYRKFVFNYFAENTYLIWDDTSLEALVIDPGCFNEAEEIQLDNFIDSANLKLKYLLNTHCHLDHVFGNNHIIEKYKPKFLIGEAEKPILMNLENQGKMFNLKLNKPILPDEFLDENTEISLGDIQIKPFFTPGHSPGEYSFIIKGENISPSQSQMTEKEGNADNQQAGLCFSGDVLFLESIGRTDLWGGNFSVLINSIKAKLFSLPDEYLVLSGHGDETTIGYEKMNNEFLR